MTEKLFYINNGRVVNPKEVEAVFRNLKDGKHLLTIKDYRRRSLKQNAFYWAIVVPLVRRGLYDAGFDEVRENEEAHEIMKHVLLKKRIINHETGEVYELAGSSASLNIPEFNDYLEAINKWAAEYLGVIIPDPNQEIVEFDKWSNELVNEQPPF